MSAKKNSTTPTTADRTAELEKALDCLWASLDKIPSYRGKARFMDRLNHARKLAHNLAWNAKYHPES